mgnify:CR=1 FL=1
MLKFIRNYVAVFTVTYADYMSAIQSGIIVSGARLTADKTFVYRKSFEFRNRDAAVHGICQWYWEVLKGSWGQASNVLVISDPFQEVTFSDDFVCASRANNYLDEETKLRVVLESNNVLAIEDKVGTKHHPANSLKRLKRRRVYHVRVAESLYKHPNAGTYYYRRTVTPQLSTGGTQGKPGNLKQRRKVENVRLTAKSKNKAITEVWRRFGVTIDHNVKINDK